MKKLNILLFIVGLVSLSSCSNSGGVECGPPFEDTEGIKQFILGKWHNDIYVIDHDVHYRYEITSDKVKYWTTTDGNWNIEPDDEVGYFLGEERESWNKEQFRPLVLDEAVLGLELKGTALRYDYNSFSECYSFRYDNALKRGW